MEIVWDRQCPRATSPSPPFLGKGFWSGWVWKAASDSCLPARPPGPLLNQPWFGPEPQQWCIPGVAEGQSFSAPLYHTAGAAWMCDNSKRRHFISNCLPWRFQRPWRPWKADSFNCSVLQRRSRHSARRFFTNNNVSLPFSPWESRSKPSQWVRLLAVRLCLDSVWASPPFSRSLSKSVTHLWVEHSHTRIHKTCSQTPTTKAPPHKGTVAVGVLLVLQIRTPPNVVTSLFH